MELVSDLSADFVRTTKELERFEAELSAAKSFGGGSGVPIGRP